MSHKLIFFFFSYILTLCALSIRREEKGEAVLAELVCLAEEKGGAMMNSSRPTSSGWWSFAFLPPRAALAAF
ncbi:hypothetical protein N7501_010149 [Penicillium viridicatum]|nr:hypothetical protein N7501_010149 [Penicillium viridicatum]